MGKKNILIVFGTRPEAIKMAPLVKIFKKDEKNFNTRICVTGQHRELLDQVLEFFSITPDYDLNLMNPNQNLHNLTSNIITSIKPILEESKPDYVFVHGDTTTSMAVALSAFYLRIKVCHIEAGLRTFNKSSPFPEELNRQITGRISDFHFAPTQKAKQNLINEGIIESTIIVSGNTVIDALLEGIKIIKDTNFKSIEELKASIDNAKDFILVTGHRRENHGKGFDNIISALKEIANEYPKISIVYPVHPNPNVKVPIEKELGSYDNIYLIPPQSYEAFIWLMNNCKFILTDSGGIQEEAPSLGKMVLVMRENTERPEALETGVVKLVGANRVIIVKSIKDILERRNSIIPKNFQNPYGNGDAAEIIYTGLLKIINSSGTENE